MYRGYGYGCKDVKLCGILAPKKYGWKKTNKYIRGKYPYRPNQNSAHLYILASIPHPFTYPIKHSPLKLDIHFLNKYCICN